MSYWDSTNTGAGEFSDQDVAQMYLRTGGKTTDVPVAEWLHQKMANAEYSAINFGTSRSADRTAAMWRSAYDRAPAIAAAAREATGQSQSEADAEQVAGMDLDEYAMNRLALGVKNGPEAEKEIGMFGEQQTRVSLADRQPFDIWKQRKEHP